MTEKARQRRALPHSCFIHRRACPRLLPLEPAFTCPLRVLSALTLPMSRRPALRRFGADSTAMDRARQSRNAVGRYLQLSAGLRRFSAKPRARAWSLRTTTCCRLTRTPARSDSETRRSTTATNIRPTLCARPIRAVAHGRLGGYDRRRMAYGPSPTPPSMCQRRKAQSKLSSPAATLAAQTTSPPARRG